MGGNALIAWVKSQGSDVPVEINIWQVIAVLIAIAISVFAAWWRLREGSVRISQRREQHLRKLLEKKQSLLKVPPLLLQMNVRQAFGRSMDEREFVFIQARHNPMALLKKRLSAGDFVRLRAGGDGYEDARTSIQLRQFPCVALSWLFPLAGGIFLPPAIYLVLLAWTKGGVIAGVLATLETIALLWFVVYVSTKAQAASEVLGFEELHPVLGSAWKPDLQESPTPQKSEKPKRGRKTKEDDLPTPPSTSA